MKLSNSNDKNFMHKTSKGAVATQIFDKNGAGIRMTVKPMDSDS